MENETEKKTSWFESVAQFIFETAKFAVIALVIVIPFRIFIAQPFIVNGSSMHPTFESGEYLIVDQISMRFSELERGEVIIFKYPNNTKKYFIKRIIGLPEEKIKIVKSQVSIEDKDGNILNIEEPYIELSKEDYIEVQLENDEYFVMGDNRAQSSDSRAWGPLKKNFIVGKPIARLLPFNKIDLFPGYFDLSAEKAEN